MKSLPLRAAAGALAITALCALTPAGAAARGAASAEQATRFGALIVPVSAHDSDSAALSDQSCTGGFKILLGCAIDLYDEYENARPVQFVNCTLAVGALLSAPQLRAIKILAGGRKAVAVYEKWKTAKGLFDLRKVPRPAKSVFKTYNSLARAQAKAGKALMATKWWRPVQKIIEIGGSTWDVGVLEWHWLKVNWAAKSGQFEEFAHELASLTGLDACLDLFRSPLAQTEAEPSAGRTEPGGSGEPPVSLTIEGSTSATGFVGQYFFHQFSASGGTPPYSWSLGVAEPTDGLSINHSSGLLGGVIAMKGEVKFPVQVHDQAGNSGSTEFTVKGVGI